MGKLKGLLEGDGLFARATRGAALTALAYGFSQAMRLGANLVLTRLLFPEAFGLMALVNVFIIGLTLLSDVGIGPSIMQSKRGDDPDFLNTAWTLQSVRGGLLWLGTCALAIPAAAFYDAPALAGLLPTAGLSLLIGGFNPTRVETANRHLALGRVTALDLASQVIGTVAMIGLAVMLKSVWALAISGVLAALAKLALTTTLLPGEKNRFRWERAAARELVHFGKWIFLSTMLTFLIVQGDKAILGKFLALDTFGIYNVGFFLAGFPALLGSAVAGRILIPIYRNSPPGASPENFRKLRRMRFAFSAGLMAMVSFMAHVGVPIVEFLYDDRYAQAGPILVAIAMSQLVNVIGLTYDHAALAAGDSRRFFYLTVARAFLQTSSFATGIVLGGLQGALAGLLVASLLTYPGIVLLARRLRVWDPLHDAVFAAVALVVGALAIWRYADALLALAQLGQR